MNRTSARKADSWPASIDDHQAREDWGWKHEFDLESMTVDMLSI
jgi:nucleoside-diphosphate-sugar epimerase